MLDKNVLEFAMKAHNGQCRKYSGIPYICHPIEVAFNLIGYIYGSAFFYQKDISILKPWINAALLHDVLEDTDITESMICYITDETTLRLVKELTNPSKQYPHLSRQERKSMDREHLRYASYHAKIIKLIDRICNLRDMNGAETCFKKKYLNESLLLLDALAGTDGSLEGILRNTINDMFLQIEKEENNG